MNIITIDGIKLQHVADLGDATGASILFNTVNGTPCWYVFNKVEQCITHSLCVSFEQAVKDACDSLGMISLICG